MWMGMELDRDSPFALEFVVVQTWARMSLRSRAPVASRSRSAEGFFPCVVRCVRRCRSCECFEVSTEGPARDGGDPAPHDGCRRRREVNRREWADQSNQSVEAAQVDSISLRRGFRRLVETSLSRCGVSPTSPACGTCVPGACSTRPATFPAATRFTTGWRICHVHGSGLPLRRSYQCGALRL